MSAGSRRRWRRARRANGSARSRATHPKAKAELLSIEALPAEAVARRAKVSDLTIVPSIGAQADGFGSSIRDAALFHSGRPVLVMPRIAEGPIGETVVIAWKESVEAVRAVAAAEPFLAKAKRIKLVSITEAGEDESAAAMAEYLTEGRSPHRAHAAHRAVA